VSLKGAAPVEPKTYSIVTWGTAAGIVIWALETYVPGAAAALPNGLSSILPVIGALISAFGGSYQAPHQVRMNEVMKVVMENRRSYTLGSKPPNGTAGSSYRPMPRIPVQSGTAATPPAAVTATELFTTAPQDHADPFAP
jgi:hypothetical protein